MPIKAASLVTSTQGPGVTALWKTWMVFCFPLFGHKDPKGPYFLKKNAMYTAIAVYQVVSMHWTVFLTLYES